jgi:hypothetical protein
VILTPLTHYTPQPSLRAYLGVLVDLRLVLDVLGAVGVAQRGDGLVVVVVRGPAVRAHHLSPIHSKTCVMCEGRNAGCDVISFQWIL